MAESLSEKQRRFTRSLPLLIQYINSQPGHEAVAGELERRAAEAELNARQGDGISNSLHKIRLAIDVHLFVDGVYQQTTEAHARFGAFWKALGPDHRWGGDFKDKSGRPKPDGNHYSIEHNGVK